MTKLEIDFNKVFDHYLFESKLADLDPKSGTYMLLGQTYIAGFIGAATLAEELIKVEYGNDPNRSVAVELCRRIQNLACEAHDGKDNS
jgi:hypothetical protein